MLPFGEYTDGVELRVNRYTGTGSSNGVITAYNSNNQVINKNYKSNGYANYTNTQEGFDLAMDMLENATGTQGRNPVVILLTDGAANTALDTLFDNDKTGNVRQVYYSNNIDPMIALSTLLSAAYNKASVKAHYGITPMVYGIGVDLSSSDGSNAIIDPAKNFNSSNSNANIRSAYQTYTNTWLAGRDVSVSSGTGNTKYTFKFGHEYPQGSGITDQDIAANINYVDSYYPVASSDLESVFQQIYNELVSGAFNPISSSTTINGATGESETPLIYVDFIGQYMEVKNIQAVTLFGASYDVIKNADGTYTVEAAAGVNPTTGERYDTSKDIKISIAEENGQQKLEVKINQQILPILLEQVESNTVGGVTNATINQLTYSPLRVFYTVGISDDVLLSSGEVDVTKISSEYTYIDDATGQITLFSNAFGNVNDAAVGDAHIGFQPSQQNRYYYHQANQGIFTKVTATDGSKIDWEADEYGVLYREGAFDLTWMSYEEYTKLKAEDRVYTYVTYYRPTASQTDAASAAEEVTYLAYTDWGYLKESVAFYDATTEKYVNYDATTGKFTLDDEGYVVSAENIARYVAENPNAQLYAVLGVGSMRTSRLHNMTVAKEENVTGTADQRFTPEYTHERAADHHDNSVVIWLGNNGKLTTTIHTGIALTKQVTETIGQAEDTYDLTVTVPAGVQAAPVVKDADGKEVAATYKNNVLTVSLKAGQTVYITGIPAGTVCAIGENVKGDYYIAEQTTSVTVPFLSEVLAGAAQYAQATVTNAPNKYGNLYITKEMESDHPIPESVYGKTFAITVHLDLALAGKTFAVNGLEAVEELTADDDGNLRFTIKASQTVEIVNLPEGTKAAVIEEYPGVNFETTYRSRNHSGETADDDNVVIIPSDGHATVVVINEYTPTSTSVELDIVGTKNLVAPQRESLPGGSFTFKVQQWDGQQWVDMDGMTAETVYEVNESGIKTFTIENVLQGITYTQVGSWAYQVLEVKGNADNVTYDRTLYTFTVTVTDNGGQLVATVTDLNNEQLDGTYHVTFTNTYHTAPVSIDIFKDVRTDSGVALSKAGYKFTATQTDERWDALLNGETLEVYTDAAGQARLAMTYTEEGIYYYVLTESGTAGNGWIYSEATYYVTVVVTADDGVLSATMTITADGTGEGEMASVDGTNGDVYFVNTYAPEFDSILPTVNKQLSGREMKAGEFAFAIFADGVVRFNEDGTIANLEDALILGANDENGNVVFEKELYFDKIGKFSYDVVEIKGNLPGVSYDATIYDLVLVPMDRQAANNRLSLRSRSTDSIRLRSFHGF